MKLQAFSKAEVAKIYRSKLIYSLVKYEQQGDDFKEFNHDKYCTALNLMEKNFDNNIIDEVIDYLDNKKSEYIKIANDNQEVIDLIADQLVKNLANQAYMLPNDLEKCRFLFEYVSKMIKYDYDSKRYNRFIPFGEDYDFEFYNGIPLSNSYKGLLVTKAGLSDNIANLMVFLGYKLGLDIGIISCQNYNGSYMINTVNINGNISYMDVTSAVREKNPIEYTCLVDRATLLKNNNYSGIKEEGVLIPMDYSNPYNFNKLFKDELKIMPKTVCIKNSKKEKTL